jgi:multidrug resistance efflux pump
MRALKRRPIVVLIVVGVALAGAYFAYTWATGPGDSVSEEGTQLIPVRRGGLVDAVSINGTLKYSSRETLSFGSQGVVGEVLVETGQRVGTGQLLARLDPETIASLERDVVRARIDLRGAEEALEAAKAPPSNLRVAKAVSDVADARISLRTAQQSLESLKSPSPQELARAHSAVADAQVALASAREARDGLVTSSDADLAKARLAVADAQADLQSALAARHSLLVGATALELAESQAEVADARAVVRSAREARDRHLGGPSALEMAEAHSTVAKASMALESAEQERGRLLGGPSVLEMAEAHSTVAKASMALKSVEQERDRLLGGPSALETVEARAAVADAKAAHEAALHALERLQNPPVISLAEGESAVATAQVSLQGARQVLEDLLSGASEDEMASARKMVESAESALATAGADLAAVIRDWNDKVDTVSSSLDAAERAYANVFRRWLGIEVEPSADSSPDIVLDSLGVDLDVVFDDKTSGFSRNVAPRDDPSTPWDEIIVYAWLVLFPGTLVISCDNDTTSFAALCIGGEMDDAYQALQEARDGVEDISLQRTKAVGLAEKVLADSEDLLAERRKALDELSVLPTPLEVRNQRTAVALAEAKLGEAEADLAALESGPDPAALEVKRQEVDLTLVALTQAREDLAVLTADADPVELEVLERQVALAEAELQVAADKLSGLLDEGDAVQLEVLERQVALAEAEMLAAEDKLSGLLGEADAVELEVLEQRVEVAQAGLKRAEADLQALTWEPNAADLEALDRKVAVAQTGLEQAQRDLQKLVGDADPLEMAAREAAVDLAVASLADAEAALEGLERLDELQIELLQADVSAASAALDSALDAVESATLKAPWPGLVEEVEFKSGQKINQDATALVLVDTSTIEIDGFIDEIDVLSVHEGTSAVVTLDALPDQALQGEVSRIGATAGSREAGGGGFAPFAGPSQSTVTYAISVRVTTPDGLELPEGLSALAKVVIREEKDALLIPVQALRGGFDSPTVRVQGENGPEDRPVVLGISDDFWTVVTEGLTEGEMVVTEVRPPRPGDPYDFQ